MSDTLNPESAVNAAKRDSNRLATTNLTNQLADAINGRGVVPFTSNVDPRQLGKAWQFIGCIVDAGPDGEADFANNVYWVRPQFILEGGALVELEHDGDATAAVEVTNLAETPPRPTDEALAEVSSGSAGDAIRTDGPHLLRRGLYVPVWGELDGSADNALRYYTFRDPPPLWVRITGAVAIGAEVNRWQYSWIEQEYQGTGRWRDLPGGLTSAGVPGPDSSSATPRYAYNALEANNSAAGIQGNGYDVSYLTSAMTFNPIRGGGVHRAYAVITCEGAVEYVFAAPNSIQGVCP